MPLPAYVHETLLHFVWQHRMLLAGNYTTTAGLSLSILHPGETNSHAGPDFTNARIEVDRQLWAGNVEIHLETAGWHQHGHEADKAYNNTILHVVYASSGKPCLRSDGSVIPEFELKPWLPENLMQRYRFLMENHEPIPCTPFVNGLDSKTILPWLDRMALERLEVKSSTVKAVLKQTANHWPEAFYLLLARGFGFGLNAGNMELLARSLPFQLVQKYQQQPAELKALVLGQSGLFATTETESEVKYNYLKHKHNLTSAAIPWSFFRTRPGNFPNITVEQFASALCFFEPLYLAAIMANGQATTQLLKQQPVGYKTKTLSKTKIQNLLLNVVLPFAYTYARIQCDEPLLETCLKSLQELPAESNATVRTMQAAGFECSNAADSQALLHMHRTYCQPKACARCGIGKACLRVAEPLP